MANSIQLGYCTNVHAGVSLDEVKLNLEKYSIPVRKKFRPHESMEIGLWLTDMAARELLACGVGEFKDWLEEQGLVPFTFNAFPFSDFHQPIVKHNVYKPTWSDASRLEYTMNIAEIQAGLLKEGQFGSISTLPLGWPDDQSTEFMLACAANLKKCATALKQLKDQTGRHIFLSLEPEPGCIFDVSQDVIDYFSQYLLGGSELEAQNILEHIGVCHDVCHASVMGETQADAIRNYEANGIRIGKYQISSAIRADFRGASPGQTKQRLELLNSFAEDRYLHQTMVDIDGQKELYEDLPAVLKRHRENPKGIWTIHFHVPVYADTIGHLETTQKDIVELLNVIPEDTRPLHLEVETYAWTVMPDESKSNSLVEVIAKELEYTSSIMNS